MKKCCKCGEERCFSEFNKDTKRKDGLQSTCRACMREYREANKEKISSLNKKWREENKEILYEKKKAYRIKNREAHNARNRRWLENNREQNKERNRKYYQENKEKIKERQRKYRQRTKEERLDRIQKRKQTDPSYKIQYNISRSVYKALKKVNATKGGSTFEHLPYTPQQLKEHIESQFEDWMTWDNWGQWHIDHIVPQSALLYDSLEHPNFQKCWALENLRPLSAEENLKKSNKIIS